MLKSSELAEYIKDNAKHKDNGTYEIRNICFEVDVPYIISYLNEGVELDWYKEVYEPVSEPQINGLVNKLKYDKLNRQAQITMSDHEEIFHPTYICTTSMTYYIEDNKVNVSVCMRSNDVKRFPNDVAWQQYTLNKICSKLGMQPGKIFWFAVSFHVYNKDWFYFEKLPYNIKSNFKFNLFVNLEGNSYKEIEDSINLNLEEWCLFREETRETDCNKFYITYKVCVNSILSGKMEAYFNEDETDINLEEEFEYSIDDIIDKCNNELVKTLFSKIKTLNIVEIKSEEISHSKPCKVKKF